MRRGKPIDDERTMTPEYSITVSGETIKLYAMYEKRASLIVISVLEENSAIFQKCLLVDRTCVW